MGKTYGRMVLQGILVVAAFCYWGVLYPFALAWQEQFQLFLFDKHYLLERLTVPGGVAAYLSEFLVQFYNNPYMGAVVVALTYLAVQALAERLMRHRVAGAGKDVDVVFVTSFVPPLLIWYMMGDENLMAACVVSLIVVLAAMNLVPTARTARLVFGLVAIPVTYWVAGPMVFVLALYLWAEEVHSGSPWSIATGAGLVVYAMCCVLFSAGCEPYPLRRLMGGIYYYRLPEVLSVSVIVLSALSLLLPLLAAPLQHCFTRKKRQRTWTVASLVCVVVAGMVLIPIGYDAKKYELIEYDYLVRLQRWNDIIWKAERNQPDLPMSVCATNLALGMTGQLGERAFHFFQNGPEGLFPKFSRDFSSTQLTGETYFQLGLVNTAQRFAFEAMESIPNYSKSGRVMKRIAETNLINGEYKVAEKYLSLLKKTMFYRKWAQTRLDMIANLRLIDEHPLYGYLRKVRLTDDFLFSETEIDKICGQLLAHNKANRLAMQYLVLFPLLNRDLDSFQKFFGYVNSVTRYNPTMCQEATVFTAMLQKKEAPRGWVGDDVAIRFKSFAQTYTYAGKESPQLETFKNTYWYYFMKK